MEKLSKKTINELIQQPRFARYIRRIINKNFARFINDRVITLDDLMQVGLYACLKGMQTYNKNKNRKLTSHLYRYITTYIKYYINENYFDSVLIKREKLYDVYNKRFKNKEMSENSELLNIISGSNLSYHIDVRNENNKIFDIFNRFFYKLYEEKNRGGKYNVELFKHIIDQLEEDEHKIIKKRFLDEVTINGKEMAKKLGVSHVTYYNKIEKPLLERLKKLYLIMNHESKRI